MRYWFFLYSLINHLIIIDVKQKGIVILRIYIIYNIMIRWKSIPLNKQELIENSPTIKHIRGGYVSNNRLVVF